MAFRHPDTSGLWQKNKAHAGEYARIYPTRLHALAHMFFSSQYAWVKGRLEEDQNFSAARDEPYRERSAFTDPACSPFYDDVPIVTDGIFLNDLDNDYQVAPGAVLPPSEGYANCFTVPLDADIDHLAALAMLLKNLHLNPQSLSTMAYTEPRRDELHGKDRGNIAALLVRCLDIVEKRGAGGEFACACTRLACLLPELNRIQNAYAAHALEIYQRKQEFEQWVRNLTPEEWARISAEQKRSEDFTPD